MARHFNDDYYAVPIQEWEDRKIPAVVWHNRLQWAPLVAVAVSAALGDALTRLVGTVGSQLPY